MKEIWKPVVGYETRYAVSNTGVVERIPYIRTDVWGRSYNMPEKLMTPRLLKGYVHVDLTAENGHTRCMSVHRIVANAFIPNPEDKPQVNHINGIKNDNRVENLEWVTPKENMNNAVARGVTRHSEARKKQIQQQWSEYWADPEHRKQQSERRKQHIASKAGG